MLPSSAKTRRSIPLLTGLHRPSLRIALDHASQFGLEYICAGSVAVSQEPANPFAPMAQPPVPVQLAQAVQRHVNHTEERLCELFRRLVDLENRCDSLAVQISAIHRGMRAPREANAQAPVQSGKAQAPPPKKAPPPLPVEDTGPGPIGPQPVDMQHQTRYQRQNGFKAPPPTSVVRSLNVGTPNPTAFHTKAPPQNPPIPPPAQTPPVSSSAARVRAFPVNSGG